MQAAPQVVDQDADEIGIDQDLESSIEIPSAYISPVNSIGYKTRLVGGTGLEPVASCL